MNKFMHMIFLGMVVLGLSSTAESYDTYDLFSPYMYQYHLESNQKKHKVKYGYAPYYFSDNLRSRYWYTPEEEGHYILGYREKPWPFRKFLSDVKLSVEEVASLKDDDGVLVSLPAKPEKDQKAIEEEVKAALRETLKQERTPRIEDSKDLERVIQESKWEFETKGMNALLDQ